MDKGGGGDVKCPHLSNEKNKKMRFLMLALNSFFIIAFRKDNSCGYQENLLYLQIGLLVNQIMLVELKCVFIFVNLGSTWGLRQLRNGMTYHALQQQDSGLFANRNKRYDLKLLKYSTFEGCFS